MNVEKLVEEIAPQVKELVLRESTKALAQSVEWDVRHALQKQVQEYVVEKVMPDVLERLQAEHQQIVEAICQAVHVSAELLRDKIVETTAKRLQDDYRVRKVMKELLE